MTNVPPKNLSTGISTKPVTLVPDGAGIRNRWSPNISRYIPLSVFFSGMQFSDDDPGALWGYRMPQKNKSQEKLKDKKSGTGSSSSEKNSDNVKDKKTDNKENSITAQVSTKDNKSAHVDNSLPASSPSANVSQGSKQESLSRLLDIALGRQLISRSEMTITANVPTLPVPIGAGDGRKFLDVSDNKKKKKKKKSISRGFHLLLRR